MTAGSEAEAEAWMHALAGMLGRASPGSSTVAAHAALVTAALAAESENRRHLGGANNAHRFALALLDAALLPHKVGLADRTETLGLSIVT